MRHARVMLVCDRLGCPARFEASREVGFATLGETSAEARKAGWGLRRHPGKRRFDENCCDQHDSVLSAEDHEKTWAALAARRGDDDAAQAPAAPVDRQGCSHA
jgi:hypothetical protein